MAMFDSVLYALLRTYVQKSLIGAGAIKGASCQILSIERNLTDDGTVVTFKYEDNAGGVHTSTMNVPDGIDGEKGDKGDKGDKGNTGERGLDGAAGPAGRTATVQIGSVTSGEIASIENVGTNNDAVFNFVLPKGEKGDKGANGEDGQDGKSFDIKGQYPTYAALIAAHPTGDAGEAYFVGTDNNPDLYIWLTDDQVWHNSGKIAGIKGDKGDTGEDGYSPIASVTKTGGTATFIVRDKTGQTSVQIKDGEKGDPGVGEPVFRGTQAQWDGLTLEQKLQYLTGMVVINDDYDESDYVKKEEIGTAAAKNATDRVSPNNTGLVESQSVYSAIQTALSSIYTPRGDITCAELTSSLLIDANVGNVYETSDSGTTTALFLQGAGVPISAGSNVGIINAGQGRILFNLMANAFDLTAYQKKDLTQAIEGETTVEGALGALAIGKVPVAHEALTNNDCNTFAEGFHVFRTTGNSTNRPVTRIGLIYSFGYKTGVQLRLTQLYMSNDETPNDVIAYIRGARSSDSGETWIWGDWEKLVTESELNDVFRVYEYTSSNAPTKASFLTLLASSNAHMDFKFINVVTDYMPNSSSYWYVQKFGGMDALHIRLLATDWVSGDLYTGDANSGLNTITWWRLAGTPV